MRSEPEPRTALQRVKPGPRRCRKEVGEGRGGWCWGGLLVFPEAARKCLGRPEGKEGAARRGGEVRALPPRLGHCKPSSRGKAVLRTEEQTGPEGQRVTLLPGPGCTLWPTCPPRPSGRAAHQPPSAPAGRGSDLGLQRAWSPGCWASRRQLPYWHILAHHTASGATPAGGRLAGSPFTPETQEGSRVHHGLDNCSLNSNPITLPVAGGPLAELPCFSGPQDPPHEG